MRAYSFEFHIKTWRSRPSRKAFQNAINIFKESGGNAKTTAKKATDIPVDVKLKIFYKEQGSPPEGSKKGFRIFCLKIMDYSA